MRLISHRRNTIDELLATPVQYGVEVDIRSWGYELVLQHDPFVKGQPISEWLDAYQHGTLILNVKEEGLECKLIELMLDKGISDYFFLDQSFPFLVKYAAIGERRCAVRVSEYESIETALALAGKVEWVWVDCFTRFPLSSYDASLLSAAGFKLCVVSPELHGRPAEEGILAMISALSDEGIQPDAVCTKRLDLWEQQWVIK